jgi:hypothetical protein
VEHPAGVALLQEAAPLDGVQGYPANAKALPERRGVLGDSQDDGALARLEAGPEISASFPPP